MPIDLFKYQLDAIDLLRSGSILCGGVGSGKSRTSLAYYFLKECGGTLEVNGRGKFNKMKYPKDLYIITTAKKRDGLDWEQECAPFLLSTSQKDSLQNVKLIIDSWNNLKKYINVQDAFFIFDEQRLVGYGTWVKSFLKIAKKNNWILLSATPGDTWMDYVPIFIANGFYKNKTEFVMRHVIYSRNSKFPKIDRYLETKHLEKLREQITVNMIYEKQTIPHTEMLIAPYDKDLLKIIMAKRWNIYEDQPIKNSSQLCYLMRKVINSDYRRLDILDDLYKIHKKIIIFYTYDYELELLRSFAKDRNIPYSEWNGHIHQEIKKTNTWLYLVQYTAGAEGWNCIETNVIVFFSQNYSYKLMTQAAGRIDRLNTPFKDLYYYHIRSTAGIDIAILKSLRNKKNFNAKTFANYLSRPKHTV